MYNEFWAIRIFKVSQQLGNLPPNLSLEIPSKYVGCTPELGFKRETSF